MEQISLELDNDEHTPPLLTLEPEREQALVALMAQAIVAVHQSQLRVPEVACPTRAFGDRASRWPTPVVAPPRPA